MNKTAILLYNDCCLFEITVALEMLQMAQKPVVYFSKDLKPIKSEEGFTNEDMKYMLGWRSCCDGAVPDKYLKTDNVISSVSFGFRQWAMAIGRELDLECFPKSFDLEI